MAPRVFGVHVGILIVGIALRVAAIHFGHDLLKTRMELVSHHNAFDHIREALFLKSLGQNPYSDGDFHQPPLVLAVFEALNADQGGSFDVWAGALVIAGDVLAAIFLINTLRLHLFTPEKIRQTKHSLTGVPANDDVFVSSSKDDIVKSFDKEPSKAVSNLEAFALLNPFSICTVGALSSSVFLHAAIAAALYFALASAAQNSFFSRLAFHLSCGFSALAGHLSPTALLLALPLAVVQARRTIGGKESFLWRVFVGSLFGTTAYTILLVMLSATVLQSWTFVTEYYVWIFAMRGSLIPNLGFWWYVFQEVFARFRWFYLVFWAMQPIIFFIPVTVAFRRRPAAAVALLSFLFFLTQPFPTIGDTSFSLSCLLLFPATFSRIPAGNFLLCMLIFPLFMLPVMWFLWLYPTSGNANFIYFQTIVFQIANIRLAGGFAWSSMDEQRILDAGDRAKKEK